MAKAKILSALLVTLGILFACGQAQAQNPPPPQCNAGSINYNGDVNIAPPGGGNNDCIINGDVTATGYIRINAPTGKIVVTGNITASNHGNVILSAGSTVEVGGSIIVNNASSPLGQAGSVDIKANSAGSGPAFVIGSASSNGVAGTINTDTALGGGNDPFFVRGGIRIRNRDNITLTSMSALSVKGTASRSGVIILEAVDGTLSLPTGTLSADGQTGQSAGVIVLQAHAITTQDGTIVSASDSVGQASHFVNIAAQTVSYTGSTGLTIRANGGGSTANGTGSFVYALPEFGIFVTDDSTTNPQNFTWTVTYPFGTAYPGALTWSGATGSPLTVTANGTAHTQVLMSGYPLTFGAGAGDVLLAARGNEDHRVDLTYTGSTSGINGLVFASNKVTLNANANANSGQGGAVFVSMPKTVSTSPQQVLFTADGPSSASGNGGNVQFFPKGDISIGSNPGQIHLSAQSGSTGGNGGRATVSNKPFTTELASNTAVQVTARGQNGDGGYLELRSLFANFNSTGLKLAADAAGTGKGGQVVLDVDGPITVGSGFGAVKLSAEADATVGSDGGRITVISGSSADITSGQLSVKSGPTGSGGQLDLTIGGSLSLTGSLKADAGLSGNGHGGLVKVDAGDLVLNGSTTGGGQSLSADGAGMGAGGSVTAIIQASSQPTTIASGQLGAVSLSANGGKNASNVFMGAGGTIQLTDLNEGFIINGGALDVKSGPGQNAGSILVDAGTTLAVSGDIKAVGTGNSASGGTIRLTAQSNNPVVFSGTSTTNILADGGAGTTGNAGHITISNAGMGNIEFQQKVILSATADGTSGGNSGTISIATGGDIIFTASGNQIKTNGSGAVGVENIHIEAAGNITSGNGPGQVDLVAKGTASGHQGGFVRLISTNGDISLDSTSIDVRSGGTSAPQGDGGTIRAEAAGSIVATGNFQANGRGTGKGGHIGLLAGQSLNIGSAEFHADGGNKGNGGVLELSSFTSLSINASTVSANAGTGSNSNAAGGQISISAVGASSDLTLNGNLSVNGSGSGAGGTLALFAGQFLDVSASELHANGATGGSISLSYGGDQPLTVLSLTATGTSQNGGTVEIQHTADNDVVIVLTGTVDTRSNGELAGLFKVLAFDENTNSISVTVNDTGSFDSIVGAVGKSVDFTSFTFVNVGIDEVESKDGDVSFCIDGSGTCTVAVAAKRSTMRSLQATESTLTLFKRLTVRGGKAQLESETCNLQPDFRAVLIQAAPAVRALNMACNNVNFANNALIDASQSPNEVAIRSIAGSDLSIRLPSAGKAGITGARRVLISPTGIGAVTVQASGTEPAIFALGTQTSTDAATISADNNLTIQSNVQIGENDPLSPSLPKFLVLEAVAGDIFAPATIYALKAVVIDNGASLSPITVGNIDTIGTGTTSVRITSGTNISQVPLSSINAGINDPNSGGAIILKSTFGVIGDSDEFLRVSATDLEIEALGSGGGSAYVEQIDATQISLRVCKTTTNLRIKAKGNIVINENLSTFVGDIQILATNGTITTNTNVSKGPVITSGGGVQFAIGSFPTTPIQGTPPSNVTVLPGTGTGQVYWGAAPGLSATGFNTVQANDHNIVFEVNGVSNGIVLRGGVSITAN